MLQLLIANADEVEVDVKGKIVKDWCHVLINGTGFLNSWKCLLSRILEGWTPIC